MSLLPLPDKFLSVPQPARLLRNLVLIAWPPRERRVVNGIVRLPTDQDTIVSYGRVVQVAPSVVDVVPGDRVVFNAVAAEDVLVNDWPCSIVPVTQIEAVVEEA